MAHRLRQTSLIFRQVEILLAHRQSKWTDSEAGKSFQPFHKSLASLPKKPRLAQKQQHKQQQQRQQQTKQQTIAKPFQNLSGLGFDWLQF